MGYDKKCPLSGADLKNSKKKLVHGQKYTQLLEPVDKFFTRFACKRRQCFDIAVTHEHDALVISSLNLDISEVLNDRLIGGSFEALQAFHIEPKPASFAFACRIKGLGIRS